MSKQLSTFALKHSLGISNEVGMEGSEQVFQPFHYIWTKSKGFEPPSFLFVHNNGLPQKKGTTFSLIYIETLVLQKQNHHLLQ
jgi:hypothetical protein